jgi:ubiquinone/menaquinone biosynthesis C-methylase UbiE
MNEFDEKAATWDDDPERVKRAEVIADHLASAVDLTGINSALEYGSGTGLLSFCLKDKIVAITLMDDSEEMTKMAIKKCNEQGVDNLFPVKGDLITGPLPETKFDLIFILLTLHHIDDVKMLLGKFNASLSPSGKLAIIDLEKEDGSFHDGPFHGHKGFGRTDLENMLRGAGFVAEHYEVCYNIEKETEEGTKNFHFS